VRELSHELVEACLEEREKRQLLCHEVFELSHELVKACLEEREKLL
jgi:hypothetical protein